MTDSTVAQITPNLVTLYNRFTEAVEAFARRTSPKEAQFIRSIQIETWAVGIMSHGPHDQWIFSHIEKCAQQLIIGAIYPSLKEKDLDMLWKLTFYHG